MSKLTRDLLLVTLGALTLKVAFGGAYLNYVRPGFLPLLVIAGVLTCALGILGVLRPEVGADHDQGHAHGGPPVTWLLLLPVAVLVIVAPSALGSFTAEQQSAPPELSASVPDAGPGPNDPGAAWITMSLSDYSVYSAADATGASPLDGRDVRLVGFVRPRDDGSWYVSRIMIACCAADAGALSVVVDAPPGELEADQWVEVIGRRAPDLLNPDGQWPEPVIEPINVRVVEAPEQPYEI